MIPIISTTHAISRSVFRRVFDGMMTRLQIIPVLLLFMAIEIQGQSLPVDKSTLFSGSGNCSLCHSAQGNVLVAAGEDISPVSTWRSTMMANADRDPLWQAKVTAEVAENPHLGAVIEDKCTTCHAPMGHTEAIHTGADHFPLAQALTDPLSLDGVSCTLCHQIQDGNLGEEESYSGHFVITDDHVIYGPYPNPTAMPMFNQTGYTPVHSPHLGSSELCATCHTLFTPFVDAAGNVAGTFPEQTPYLEWQNSIYPEQNIECQTCHMPAVDEALKIASRPPWLATQRQPVWKHDFVGANAFMVDLIKENAAAIGATASSVHFDSTLAKERRLLRDATIELDLDGYFSDDSLNVLVSVKNLAGHKFPSGFPSRRAWLFLEVKNQQGEIIFASGAWDEQGEIIGLDEPYEPHHDVITSSDQVQVYQSLMQDVNGDITYTLLRGAAYAKDNRLPPAGFKTTFADYQAVAVVGRAVFDDDFLDGELSDGVDRVSYKMAAQEGEYDITVAMLYQTMAPRFFNDLVKHESALVNRFGQFYSATDKQPVLVQEVKKSLSTGIGQTQDRAPDGCALIRNFPNPFNASTCFELYLPKADDVKIDVYSSTGRLVRTLDAVVGSGWHRVLWDGKDEHDMQLPSGLYLAVLRSDQQRIVTRSLLLR